MLITLILAACSTPEDEASEIALRYANLPLTEVEQSYAMVCADDKAAKSLAEQKAALEALKESFPDLFKEKAEEDQVSRSVQSVELDAGKTSGTVHLEPTKGDETDSQSFRVQKEGEDWCIVTGWAEIKRYEDAATKAQGLVDEAKSLKENWKFDEASAKLDEVDIALAEIPEEHFTAVSVRSDVAFERTMLDTLTKDWLGGRWSGSTEKDPMTDQENAVVYLESLDSLTNSVGLGKKAALIVRCQKGKFEAYVNAGTVLDSNWRYDTVSGQHRFGDAKAEKLIGGVSTSRDAVFLRDPKSWARRFKESDGSKWLVELPVYNRTPQTVTFDLTGSTKAIDMVLGACGG
ncbi:MAG: hypothetical protein H6739_39010 [Alphaproteobacteria bacterium]|nr:hypothetical protein [Alphaproteobacteria bacterium]